MRSLGEAATVALSWRPMPTRHLALRHRHQIALAFALAVTWCSGQASSDTGGRSLNVGLVLEQVQLRDDLVRPFRFAGPSGGVSLGFAHVTAKAEHDAQFALGLAYLTNSFGQESFAFRIRGHYRYLRSLSSAPATMRVSLGVAARANWLPTYHADWDDAHLYWFTSYDVGPTAKVQWHSLGPGSLLLSLDLPIFALVSRPPRYRFNKQDELKSLGYWFAEPHSDLTLATLTHYKALGAGVTYVLHGTGRWRLAGSYTFDLRSYDRPVHVSTLAHSLTLEARRVW